MKITRQDRKEIADFTKAALQGLLADHQCCGTFDGLSCPQSTSEWAVLFGIETHLRLKRRLKDMETRQVKFPTNVKAYQR